MIDKMKFGLVLICLMSLLLGVAACEGVKTEEQKSASEAAETSGISVDNSTTENSENTEIANTDEATAGNSSDILVVYFSRIGEQYGVGVIDEGNTAIVAKMIQEKTGADIFEIKPVDDHYPLEYDELTDMAKKEQSENARPAYEEGVPDLSKYSTVFIGAPVWWGDWPMICYTFFEKEELSGKTLYPFSTHAGSGLSGFDKKLSSAVPDSTVGKGLAVSGTDCQNNKDSVKNSVEEWLSELGY